MKHERARFDLAQLCCDDDERGEAVRRWVIDYLQFHPEIEVIVLLSSYGCASECGADSLQRTESKMSEEVKQVRAVLQEFCPWGAPKILGCLYDDEFDWLAIYDEDTGMFLPPIAFEHSPALALLGKESQVGH
jgi:hypothetical protein